MIFSVSKGDSVTLSIPCNGSIDTVSHAVFSVKTDMLAPDWASVVQKFYPDGGITKDAEENAWNVSLLPADTLKFDPNAALYCDMYEDGVRHTDVHSISVKSVVTQTPNTSIPVSLAIPPAFLGSEERDRALAAESALHDLITSEIARAEAAEADKEPSISESDTSKFFRGDKTWSPFGAAVLSALLPGIVLTDRSAVSAADSILSAIGKCAASANSVLELTCAQADALSVADKKRYQRIYITDCLTASGVGSDASYDRTNDVWRMPSRVRACDGLTLQSLWDFFRSCADVGFSTNSPKMEALRRGNYALSGEPLAVASVNSAYSGMYAGNLTIATGAAVNGASYRTASTGGIKTLGTAGLTTFFRVRGSLPSVLSTSGEGYSWYIGLGRAGSPALFNAEHIRLLYDERNANGLSLANTANLYFTRRSTNTVTIDTGIPAVAGMACNFEGLYNSTYGLCLALNGVTIASGLTTEVSLTGDHFAESYGIIKSTGTTNRDSVINSTYLAQLSS